MSGKSRRASTTLSLSHRGLDGYVGLVDIVSPPRRLRWWERMLRRKPRPAVRRVFVNVRGDTARMWKP